MPGSSLGRTMVAAVVYFAIVFVIAFGLGTIRVLQVVPKPNAMTKTMAK